MGPDPAKDDMDRVLSGDLCRKVRVGPLRKPDKRVTQEDKDSRRVRKEKRKEGSKSPRIIDRLKTFSQTPSTLTTLEPPDFYRSGKVTCLLTISKIHPVLKRNRIY